MAKDYYLILGVAKEASVNDVKKAYHELAKFYHPDKYPNAPERILKANEEKLKDINEAYKVVLKEVEAREKSRLGDFLNGIFNGRTKNKVKTEDEIIRENEIAFDEFQDYYVKIKDRMLRYNINLVEPIDRLLNPSNRGKIMAKEFADIKVIINDALNDYIGSVMAYDELMKLIDELEPKYNEFGQTLKEIKMSLINKRGKIKLEKINSYMQKIKDNYRHIKNKKMQSLFMEIEEYAAKIGIDLNYFYNNADNLFSVDLKNSLPNLELVKKTIIEQLAIYGECEENEIKSTTNDVVNNIKAYNDLMGLIGQIEPSYKRYGATLENLKAFLKDQKGVLSAAKIRAIMLHLRLDFKLLKMAKKKDLQVEVLNYAQELNYPLETILQGRKITDLSYFELNLIKEKLLSRYENNIFVENYVPQK